MSIPASASSQPLDGLKLSRIMVCRDNTLWFGPAFSGTSFTALFSANDKAVCSKFTGHLAPYLRCTCGFYAVKNVRDLDKLGPLAPFSVLSEVSLGGTIIEHELGLRSQLQSITRVMLPESCSVCCKKKVTHLRAARSYLPPAPMLPVCHRCSRRLSVSLSRHARPVSEVSKMLGVPINTVSSGVLSSAPPYRPIRLCLKRYSYLTPLLLLPFSTHVASAGLLLSFAVLAMRKREMWLR